DLTNSRPQDPNKESMAIGESTPLVVGRLVSRSIRRLAVGRIAPGGVKRLREYPFRLESPPCDFGSFWSAIDAVSAALLAFVMSRENGGAIVRSAPSSFAARSARRKRRWNDQR